MILLIDNYDSFVHNLARYLRRLGAQTEVVRNDQVSVQEICQISPNAIVLSPGPGTPWQAGCSLDVVAELQYEIPILGVCLGHQVIAAAFGAEIVRATQPMHGRTSSVLHIDSPLFQHVASPLQVCRYHSLVVEPASIPEQLQVTATCDDGTVMALEHRTLPVAGVQFHPEALLSECGYQILANFLHQAGMTVVHNIKDLVADEFARPTVSESFAPSAPVTF